MSKTICRTVNQARDMMGADMRIVEESAPTAHALMRISIDGDT